MAIKFLPTVAALELTYKCNHKCLFCSCPWEADFTYKSQELTVAEWKNAIGVLLSKGVKSFTLTGGEPMMRNDLQEIVDYIYSLSAGIVMISNGRAMDGSILDFLARRSVSLCISVPGIKSFYEHTGVDNIENVLKLFETAKTVGLKTTANITVTKKNLPELYENIALPLIHGAEYVLLNRFLPGGRGLSNAEYLLTIEETNQMLEVAETVLRKANRYGHVGTELPLCAIREPDQYKHLKVSNLCSAAKGFFIIDPSGYVKVCNHSPTRVCHYSQINSIEDNSYWRSFRDRDYLPEMCKSCEYRDVCDGGCREAAHIYYGKVDDNDPIFEMPVV